MNAGRVASVSSVMPINTATHSLRSRLALMVGIVLALALVLGACSSSSKGAASSSTADITVHDFAFVSTAVKAGATVTVHNNGPSTHSVTADNGEFNIASIDPNKDATFTAPTKPGTYKFHCNFHPQMHGTLTVQ